MPGRIIRAFKQRSFYNGSSPFKGRPRFFFIVRIRINRALKEVLWLVFMVEILRRLLQKRESVREFTLQNQKLHARIGNKTIWVETFRDLRQLSLHLTEISFPINRKAGLLR